MKLISDFTNNIFSNILTSLFGLVFPIVTLPIISRRISPEGLGNVFFLDSVSRYVGMLALLGLPIYGLSKISSASGYVDKKKLISEFFSITIFNTGLVAFSVLVYFQVLKNQNIFYQALTVINIIAISLSFDWALQGLEKFKFLARRNFLIRLLTFLLIFLFASGKKADYLYFGIMVGTNVIISFSNLSHLRAMYGIKIVKIENAFFNHFRPLLFYFGAIFSVSVYTVFDTIILNYLCGEKAVAFYSVGSKVSRAATVGLTAISTVFYARLSSFQGSKKESFVQLLKISFYLILFISTLLTLTIFTFSNEIILFLGGLDYFKSVEVLKITSLFPMVIGLSNIYAFQLLSVFNMGKQLLTITFSGAILNLILSFFFVKPFSETGTAIVVLLTEFFILAALIIFSASKFSSIKILSKNSIQFILKIVLLLSISFIFNILFLNSLSSRVFFILVIIILFILAVRKNLCFLKTSYIDLVSKLG